MMINSLESDYAVGDLSWVYDSRIIEITVTHAKLKVKPMIGYFSNELS